MSRTAPHNATFVVQVYFQVNFQRKALRRVGRIEYHSASARLATCRPYVSERAKLYNDLSLTQARESGLIDGCHGASTKRCCSGVLLWTASALTAGVTYGRDVRLRRLRSVFWKIAGSFSQARLDRQIAEELQSHLALQVEESVRAGVAPAVARRAALRKLGGVQQTIEQCRDVYSTTWLRRLVSR